MPFPHLLSPITLSGLHLPNRVIMGSMHTGLEELADWPRVATFYARRAEGGVGLMITGGMAPNSEGAVFPGAAGLFTVADIAAHRSVTQAVHAAGGRIAMQILHAGRYAYGRDCVSASAVKSPISPHTPIALDEAGIEAQIVAFVTAATRARDAGYDGVEIMGSEGYLLNQFLVTHVNRRTDGWGGAYANRMRLPVEVVRRVRDATGPDFLLIYRLSLIDLIPGGSTWAEVATLARAIQAAGASALNSGIGWHEARVPTIAASVPRAAFAWLTARLKTEVSIPVIASNRINTPDVAEAILAQGQADMISMARPLLADPDFVVKSARGQATHITPCIACNQACLDHAFEGKTASCVVNPAAADEAAFQSKPAEPPRRIAVVGAGPAGLACAITAARRGHRVVLFEAQDIGGQLNLARKIPGKSEFDGLVAHYATMLQATSVTLRHKRATLSDLTGFDAIVIATGVTPRPPGIEGEHLALTYTQVLQGAPVGDKVAILGAGGIGFDIAEYLTHTPRETLADWQQTWGLADPAHHPGGLRKPSARPAPREVWLLQRKPERPGRALGKTTGWIHRAALQARGVHMLGGVTYQRITPEGLWITHNGSTRCLPVTTTILCTGQQPESTLSQSLTAAHIHHHIIGGANFATELDAKRAILEGTRLALTL